MKPALCVAALFAAVGLADTITMRDGSRHNGVLVSADRNRIVFNTDGEGRRTFVVSSVERIEFGSERSETGGSAERRRGGFQRSSEIERKAAELGRNFTGTAVSREAETEDGRGRVRVYDDATIYWSPETGAHAVQGPVRDEYLRLGGVKSRLGYPTSDEQSGPDGRTRIVTFERGAITWSRETGARVRYQ